MDFLAVGITVIVGCIAAVIDSSIGMMYGTILSPLLIAVGFEPLVVVPAVLFSQGAGGIVASIRHHDLENADFNHKSDDLQSSLRIILPGLIAVVVASLIAVSIPKMFLKIYIAILVIVIGAFTLLGISSKFTKSKMMIIGVVSAFNKTMSGGGFGPVVTGGQIVIGQESKKAIAIANISKVPICAMGFFSYFLLRGFGDWTFLLSLTAGSLIGSSFGPTLTKKSEAQTIRIIVGVAAFLLGAILLANVTGLMNFNISI